MRITGGTFRSRTLRAPRGQATRPTSEKVREALFGILSSAGVLDGSRVLDLYAGTGALALEALSRGAAEAVLVESSREALGALRANVRSLGLGERARIVAADVHEVARRLGARRSKPDGLCRDVSRTGTASPPLEGPFDLILADPPWALIDQGDAALALGALVEHGALSPRGTLVLEHASRSSPPAIVGTTLRETRRYGDTSLSLYEPAAATKS